MCDSVREREYVDGGERVCGAVGGVGEEEEIS